MNRWGQPFLEHTYLYHLSRLDHRHNFSPYFYGIYLSMFSSRTASQTVALDALPVSVSTGITYALRAIRHPLISFLPQASLVLSLGWLLEPMVGFEQTAFLQTAAFVVFNKVCTSQYFVWFIPLIPAMVAGTSETEPAGWKWAFRLTTRQSLSLVLAWVLGQAAWLGSAYRLELLAQDAYLQVWACGLLLFAASVFILGRLLDYIQAALTTRVKTE